MKSARLLSIPALTGCAFVALVARCPGGAATAQPTKSPKPAVKTKAQIAALIDRAFVAIWIDNELEPADIRYEVDAALEAGISPNMRDPSGETLLLQAIENEHFDLVEWLLKRGANPNLAVLKDDVAVPNTPPLMPSPKLQAIFDAASSKGETPLMRIIAMDESRVTATERIRVVRQLLHFGANPNARKAGGQTVLMITAFEGESGSARLLLQRGADFRLRDGQGQTALQIALVSVSLESSMPVMFDTFLDFDHARTEQEKRRDLHKREKEAQMSARKMQKRMSKGRAIIVKLLKAAGAKS